MSTILRSPAMKYGATFTSLSNLGFRGTRPSEPGMFLRAPRTLKYSLNERPSRTTTLPFRPVPARLPLLSDAAMSHKGLPSPARLWEGWLTILRNSQSSSGPSIPLASARMTIFRKVSSLPQIGRIVRQPVRSPQFLRDELKIRVRIGCFRVDMRPAGLLGDAVHHPGPIFVSWPRCSPRCLLAI